MVFLYVSIIVANIYQHKLPSSILELKMAALLPRSVILSISSLPATCISGTAVVANISGNQVSVTEPGLITTRRISIQKQRCHASHHCTSQRFISPCCWKCSEQTASVEAWIWPPVHTVNLSRMETPQPSRVTPEPLKRGTEPLKKGMEPLEMDRNRYKRIGTVKKWQG